MSTLNDPVVAAQDLRATILKGRKETEANRRLTPSIVRGLIDSGLCRLVLPKELGGHEIEPTVFLLVLEELAKAEAAVAWFVWNSAVTGFSAAVLNKQTRTELFAKPDRLFANSTRPTGKAKLVKGGFRVSGRWSLVSGCELAEWIPVMNRVIDGNGSRLVGDNTPEMRMTFIPRGSFNILDTWYVGGLRGTGSHDIVVEDVFVPNKKTYSYLDPIRLRRPLYRMPSWPTMSAGCAAICLGLAQNAIATVSERISSEIRRRGQGKIANSSQAHTRIASSMAELHAARLLLHTTIGELWETTSHDAAVTPTQCSRLWTSALHMAKTSKATVQAMYEIAGTSALYIDSPIERAHRDIHAIAQHAILAPLWLEQSGRVTLGLEATENFFSR